MKKRQNYFQVHKNKKPKSLDKKRKYVSYLSARIALIVAMGAADVARILNTPLPNYKERLEKIKNSKKIAVLNSSIGVYESIIKATKEERQRRFLLTKRYIK